MHKVILVDDHPMLRVGIADLLKKNGWSVVAEVGRADQAKAAMLLHRWDLTILDVQLPDRDGIELLQELRSEGVTGRVLVHSMMEEATVGTRVFKAGANGYLNKGCTADELLEAATRVVTGGTYASPALVTELIGSLASNQPAHLYEALSNREYQVMCQIAYGKTPTKIAEDLDCSPNTISTYRARILHKLHLKNSMEIMRYAITHRLIQI